jgi:hypothetical protein
VLRGRNGLLERSHDSQDQFYFFNGSIGGKRKDGKPKWWASELYYYNTIIAYPMLDMIQIFDPKS